MPAAVVTAHPHTPKLHRGTTARSQILVRWSHGVVASPVRPSHLRTQYPWYIADDSQLADDHYASLP